MYCCAFWLARELTQVYFSQAETNIGNLVIKLVVSFFIHISIPVSELQIFWKPSINRCIIHKFATIFLNSLLCCCYRQDYQPINFVKGYIASYMITEIKIFNQFCSSDTYMTRANHSLN